jgi:hypothetical protein
VIKGGEGCVCGVDWRGGDDNGDDDRVGWLDATADGGGVLDGVGERGRG